MILLIETSTEVCSVALVHDGRLLGLVESEDPHAHSQRLTKYIDEVMQQSGAALASLQAVAVSAGPGSYTGLRIGVSTAKGLCFALGLPLIAISTMDALAWASGQRHGAPGVYHCPMIEARRMEVWAKMYDDAGKGLAETAPHILGEASFSEYFDAGKQVCFSGNGTPKTQGILCHPSAIFSTIRCSAAHMAALAETAFGQSSFEDLAYFEPVYLKPPNITVSTTQ